MNNYMPKYLGITITVNVKYAVRSSFPKPIIRNIASPAPRLRLEDVMFYASENSTQLHIQRAENPQKSRGLSAVLWVGKV